jgi:sulfide:quinone oxidoreductase
MSDEVEFTQLAPTMYVAGQLEVADIERLVTLGVNTLVCNRPDGEGGQTDSATIGAAAQAAGIDFAYLPMATPDDTAGQVGLFKEILGQGGVVMAYCRTGRRSSTLWETATK